MNLLDLMEEQDEKPAPTRTPINCSCPSFYYPTMFVNSHIKEDVIALLEKRNFRRLNELEVRFYNQSDRKWYSWTTKLYDDFIKTARRFPKCNRSRGMRDP